MPQKEVVTKFRISRPTLWRLRRSGKVRARKIGSKVYIDLRTLFSPDPADENVPNEKTSEISSSTMIKAQN